MAETATYSWLAFDRQAAANGVLVGIRQADDNDLSYTGQLYKTTSGDKYYDSYEVVIRGSKLQIDDFGKVKKVWPASSEIAVNTQLMLVVCTMTTTYGTQQAITRSVGDDSLTTANIQALEPRDHFAMQALTAIIPLLPHPESFGDAGILSVCKAAYKWAQGMMIAAADARAAVKKDEGGGGGEEPEEEKKAIAVNTSEITETTEKLLYNITVSLDNLRVQQGNQYKEVKTDGFKVSELPDVKVSELPDVTIKGTPSVSVTNTPDVRVTNTPDMRVTNMPSVPSEPVSVTGSVSVTNFPESSSSGSKTE